jgi:hypothetical protein
VVLDIGDEIAVAFELELFLGFGLRKCRLDKRR